MAQPNPQRAVDAMRERMVFPCIGQPKVDGVRGMQMRLGQFTGRSLKPFANKRLTNFWSHEDFYGLDGELVAPSIPWTHPAMCRTTTSLTGTIDSRQVPHLIAFDYVVPQTYDMEYQRRYELLQRRVLRMQELYGKYVQLMPFVVLKNMRQLDDYVAQNRADGYEGTIVRSQYAPFKPGDSTLAMELWRIKDRLDFEVRVRGLVEAMQNNNEAKVNALGKTERSSHKANKVGKGMIGMIQGEVVKNVEWQGKVLFRKGMLIDIGPGEMNHADRAKYWENPKLIIGTLGKVAVQPYGTMDKPRQPIWLTPRTEVDL